MFAATWLPIILSNDRGVNSVRGTFAFDFRTSRRRVILSSLHSAHLFRSVVQTYPPGHITPRHEHDWPQLLYASSGVMAIESGRGLMDCPTAACDLASGADMACYAHAYCSKFSFTIFASNPR